MKNVLYIAPEVEVLDVMVEKGFAASAVTPGGGGYPWSTDEEEE